MLNQFVINCFAFDYFFLRPANFHQPKNPSIPKAPCSANQINSSTCASVMGMKSTLTGFLGQKNTFECCCYEGTFDLDLPITEFCWVGWLQIALNHHLWVMMGKTILMFWFTNIKIYTYPKHVWSIPKWQLLVTCHFAAFSPSPLTLANVHPPWKQWYIKRQL